MRRLYPFQEKISKYNQILKYMNPENKYSPALSSFNRTWPSMKIKFLSLLLIFAGIILISGCVDREAQPLTYKAPGDLYRSIFYPYTGLPDHGGPEMPGVHPHDPFHKGHHPDSESIQTLRDATSLLDSNIEKAEIISTRLEEGIQRFKAEGEDVSRLEALLGEYNRLLEEAKEYRALAVQLPTKETTAQLQIQKTVYPKVLKEKI